MNITQVEISLGAIGRNINFIRTQLPSETGIIAVVKANGYGHGALEVSKAAQSAGVMQLAVAEVDEGKYLREMGIDIPILVLGGTLPEQVETSVLYGLEQTVYSMPVLLAVQESCRRHDKQALIHIKIESGMNRLGVGPGAELDELLNVLQQCTDVKFKGMFSHFADSENPDVRFAQQQSDRFAEAIAQVHRRGYHPLLHMNNSGAIIKSHMPALDAVRLGIAMYGYDPAGERNDDLYPALKWKTQVVRVRKISTGETVSYNRRWTADGDKVIATLPVGYADGYRRGLSNNAWVLIGGRRAPIVGSICMDHCMADITHIPDVSVGSEVVLLGKQGTEEISANEMAKWISSINYEVITTIGSRVQRVYLP